MKYSPIERAMLSVSPLDKTDSEQAELQAERQMIHLHNMVYDEFKDTECYEMTITFDDKKLKRIWKTTINEYDSVESAVRVILHEFDNNFKWFVMREWSEGGLGRLHYHGIITLLKGGQTQIAKLQSRLRRYFGQSSRIQDICDKEKYIIYMLKRTYDENDYLPEEWFGSMLLHTYFTLDLEEEKYNKECLEDWHSTRAKDCPHAV